MLLIVLVICGKLTLVIPNSSPIVNYLAVDLWIASKKSLVYWGLVT